MFRTDVMSTSKNAPKHTAHGAAVTDLMLTIFRVNGRLLRAGDNLARDLNLTSARWQVLGAIVERPRTVAQIARYFESTRQGVLWVVTALVKDGIVELVDNPDHKRAKLVQFTETGAALYAEITRRQINWTNGFGDSFEVVELRRAIEVLEHLGRELGD